MRASQEGYVNAPDEEDARALFIKMMENQGIEVTIISVQVEDEY